MPPNYAVCRLLKIEIRRKPTPNQGNRSKFHDIWIIRAARAHERVVFRVRASRRISVLISKHPLTQRADAPERRRSSPLIRPRQTYDVIVEILSDAAVTRVAGEHDETGVHSVRFASTVDDVRGAVSKRRRRIFCPVPPLQSVPSIDRTRVRHQLSRSSLPTPRARRESLDGESRREKHLPRNQSSERALHIAHDARRSMKRIPLDASASSSSIVPSRARQRPSNPLGVRIHRLLGRERRHQVIVVPVLPTPQRSPRLPSVREPRLPRRGSNVPVSSRIARLVIDPRPHPSRRRRRLPSRSVAVAVATSTRHPPPATLPSPPRTYMGFEWVIYVFDRSP